MLKKWREARDRDLFGALRKIVLWQGSKEEFEENIGFKTAEVDLRRRVEGLSGLWFVEGAENPFPHYDKRTLKWLINEGVVGLVNAHPWPYGGKLYFGTPVVQSLVGTGYCRILDGPFPE
jgi:hypothetical protein